jgi:hypothetical protein
MMIVLSLDESSDVSVGAKVAMGWPAFLFIAPPGWAILMWIWSWTFKSTVSESPTTPTQDNSSPANGVENVLSEATPTVSSLTSVPVPSTLAPASSPTTSRDMGDFGASRPQTFTHTSKGSDSGPSNRSRPGASFDGFMDQASRRNLANRYGWICQLCLERIPDVGWDYEYPDPRRLSIDHIVPISQGGSDNLGNLQPVHAACNSAKGGRNITNAEFRRQRSLRNASTSPRPTSGVSSRSTSLPDKEPRAGDWRDAEAVVRQLSSEVDRAAITPEQKARAREFLRANHPHELQKYCQRGHAFTLENTYFRVMEDGFVGRQCRACKREAKRSSRFWRRH